MQQLIEHPHSSPPPGRLSRPGTLRALTLCAALFGLGTAAGGCGVDPEFDLIGSANSVQNTSPTCYTETQGDPTSCKDEATWSAYGAMACAGKGAGLTSIKFATSCGRGVWRQATYECCSMVPPVPPPRMCMWAPGVGVGACLMPDAWKKEGITFCSTHGLDFNDLKLDRPCGAGGFGAAQFECCTKSPPPPPPPPPVCTAEMLSAVSCVADTAWKTKIEATCAAKKLTVGTVTFGKACMGGHQDVQFTCCGSPPPPPPPPPPPMCTAEMLSERSCVDDTTWKTKIEATCAAKKLTVGTVTFGKVCMGGHQDVQFTCCGSPPPPPPPPPMCTAESLSAMSCVDDGTWKTRIEATCKAKMMTLGTVTFGKACMGGHQDVQFTCCGSPPPPPPPPPPMCTAETLASMSCVDDGTWKTKVEATCKAKMLSLGTVTFGRACMGGHLDVQFTCCGTSPPPPPPPPMCTNETAASMSCVDDGTWKTRAEATCAAKKLTLGRLAFGTACMGGHQDIRFTCCPSVTPPPPMCETDKAPSPAACQTPDQWKTEGDRFCTAKKLGLTGISMSGPCMGGFSEASFTCCPTVTPPPPPPPVCTAGVLGDGKSCVAEATLKTQADAICTMSGTKLTAFSPYDVCGPMGGQYLHAKYECCK